MFEKGEVVSILSEDFGFGAHIGVVRRIHFSLLAKTMFEVEFEQYGFKRTIMFYEHHLLKLDEAGKLLYA